MTVQNKRRRWSNEIKTLVNKLRKQGYTYGQLNKKFGVSKSTLNSWIGGEGFHKNFTQADKVNWARQIQPLAVLANKKKRSQRITELKNKVSKKVAMLTCDQNIKMAMLSMLYWAEGSKGKSEVVRFANTDPKLILFFVTLLRECFPLDESKFRVKIYLHHYHDEPKVSNFWSELLEVPLNQFNPSYRKARNTNKTFRENFGGICFVKYNSVYLKEELLLYALELAEKINSKFLRP